MLSPDACCICKLEEAVVARLSRTADRVVDAVKVGGDVREQDTDTVASRAEVSRSGNPDWNELAAQISVDAIRCTTAAGSGHPTTAMSSAHLLAVLFASHLNFDPSDPKNLANDRVVLSKGHGVPGLYAAMKAAGWITDDQLLSLRKLDSPLEGHPVPLLPGIDVASGSLGQGLAVGVGMALLAKRELLPYRVWVLMGDSETSEGSVWEAVQTASFYELSNLVAIVDVNRLGQRGETQLGWNIEAYKRRFEAFGWRAIDVDGHNPEAIDQAFKEAEAEAKRPTVVVARTIKGFGVSEVENKDGWHGKPLPQDMAEEAIASLGGLRNLEITVASPDDTRRDQVRLSASRHSKPSGNWTADSSYIRPKYSEPVATRKAYGESLAAIGVVRPDLYVLDAEVSNSTFAEIFAAAHPDRYVEMFIEEQCMVGAATGMAALGRTVFCSTFAAFLTRAHDFIRMASIGRVDLRLCGSHAGVSIGEDGPSQMGLEDLAMMTSLYSSTVFCPADGNATVAIVEAMADLAGISYIRTARNPTPILYEPGESFEPGGAKLLRNPSGAKVALVATGVAVHEALAAADELEASGKPVIVVDAYSIKPIAKEMLQEVAASVEVLVTVEDHRPEGGLGDAVCRAITDPSRQDGIRNIPPVVKLAVYGMPGSGKPEELRDRAGISANAIVRAVKSLLE
jgi:transketolase